MKITPIKRRKTTPLVRSKLSFRSARVGTKSCPIIYWSGRRSHPHSETKRVRPLVTYLLGPTPTLRGKHKSPFRLADIS